MSAVLWLAVLALGAFELGMATVVGSAVFNVLAVLAGRVGVAAPLRAR